MKICKKCGNVKLGIFMHSYDYGGLATMVTDVCRKCANEMKTDAVLDFLSKKEKKEKIKSLELQLKKLNNS